MIDRERIPSTLAPFNRPITWRDGRTKCGLAKLFDSFGRSFVLHRNRRFYFEPGDDISLQRAIKNARENK